MGFEVQVVKYKFKRTSEIGEAHKCNNFDGDTHARSSMPLASFSIIPRRTIAFLIGKNHNFFLY